MAQFVLVAAVTFRGHVVLYPCRGGGRLIGQVGLVICFLNEGLAHQIPSLSTTRHGLAHSGHQRPHRIVAVPSLFVIARNSCFTYKGRTVDVKQVGRELGVRYVLEGGLRKAGNRIRVTAQLVEAAQGRNYGSRRPRHFSSICPQSQ
jgi:hypothetical protein